MEIRRLTESDAPALSACFSRCYGDTYPGELFGDVSALSRHIRRSGLCSVVADAGDGRIVGHTGLTVRHPGARVAEAGNTVVDPDARGRGLLGDLGAGLAELTRELGFIGYVHYPTTAHTIMQKRSVQRGGVETGLMLDYVPAETDYVAVDRRQGRLAVTVAYQPFAAAPERDVHLPRRHRDTLRMLFEACGIPRGQLPEAQASSATGRNAQNPDAAFEWHPRRGLLSVFPGSAGITALAELDAAVTRHTPALVHVDVCLEDPDADAMVEALAARGYVFCALLPEFGPGDVLRLQHIPSPAAGTFLPELVNPGARALLARIVAETPAPISNTS